MKTRNQLLVFAALATLITFAAGFSRAQQTTRVHNSPPSATTIDGKYLPSPPPKFGGEINLNAT